jgi:hypothetical protein
MKTINRFLVVSLCVLGVSACGGGTNPSSSSTAGAAKVPLTGPMQGFITIEERSNKRVVDAWFSKGNVPASSVVALWGDGANRCVELQAANFSENNSASHVGSRWRDTLFAGESISIASRTGEISRLRAQRYGGAILYASDERWIPEALPDDAQISVTGSDQFPSFDSIPVPPLERLVRTAPTDGVTRDLSTAISWQASTATDDAIELTVAASENTEQSARSIRCWLADSGQFILPEVVRQILPSNRQSVVSLVRTRNATYDSGSAQLHVSQTSHP